jgi:outer membrane protein TolC
VTHLEIASTENTALQARLSAVAIQLRRLHASELLVNALGAGWQSEESVQSDVAAQ